MQVVFKLTGEKFDVYNVRDNKNGYPHFLVYMHYQWKYISAKKFKPVGEDE